MNLAQKVPNFHKTPLFVFLDLGVLLAICTMVLQDGPDPWGIVGLGLRKPSRMTMLVKKRIKIAVKKRIISLSPFLMLNFGFI